MDTLHELGIEFENGSGYPMTDKDHRYTKYFIDYLVTIIGENKEKVLELQQEIETLQIDLNRCEDLKVIPYQLYPVNKEEALEEIFSGEQVYIKGRDLGKATCLDLSDLECHMEDNEVYVNVRSHEECEEMECQLFIFKENKS